MQYDPDLFLYHSRLHHSATVHFNTDGIFCTCQRLHNATVTVGGHHPDGRVAHLSEPNGRNRWANLFVRRLQLQSSKRSASGWDILFSKVDYGTATQWIFLLSLFILILFHFLFFSFISLYYFAMVVLVCPILALLLLMFASWFLLCANCYEMALQIFYGQPTRFSYSFSWICVLFSFRTLFLLVSCVLAVPWWCCACRNQLQDGSRYDWSQKQQGIILSSFYWGYIITQLPGGVLAQRFGGKHVLTLGLFFTAICTMLTPLCVQYGKIVSFGFSIFRTEGLLLVTFACI